MTSAEQTAVVQAVKKRLLKGDIEIEWNDGVDYPIALDPDDPENPWVAQSAVVYKIQGLKDFVIERGFRCDGASVPRALWLALAYLPTDPTAYAAFAHDAAYRKQTIRDRVIADGMFLAILLAVNPHDRKKVPHKHRLWKLRSWAMYYGVRVGGWWVWRKNRAALVAAAAAEVEQRRNDKA